MEQAIAMKEKNQNILNAYWHFFPYFNCDIQLVFPALAN